MAKSEIHLLVAIHGMWGSPSHLASTARVIEEVKGGKDQLVDAGAPDLHVLVAATNANDHTYDGIDNGGERVAQEIYEEIDKLSAEGRTVIRFSVCGYSMGGLIGRYLLGILHTRNFFDTVTPVNFTTFATPHVGIPRYPGILSSVASKIGPRMLSASGEQFFHTDSWSNTGRPLLAVMADPTQIFFQTLALFPNITIYANAIHDISSPYATSAIELEDPFLDYEYNGIQMKFDEDYPHFVDSWLIPDRPPSPPKTFSAQWFRTLGSRRPLLPPALQFRFPLNLVIIVAIPLLMPVFISLVLYNFSKSSKHSRARIRAIEGSESYRQRLIHMFSAFENQMESAIVGVAHDVAEIGVGTSVPQEARSGNVMVGKGFETNGNSSSTAHATPFVTSKAREKSLLTEEQKEMVRSLNTIPNLKKHRVFFPEVRNSHAIIISRDPRRFKIHEKGLEVLGHWAERFDL